jgi:hypothetical protein
VKEQILIRYLGLGWEEAHHLWSKNKHQYTAVELLKHMCKVVNPLEDVKEVPITLQLKKLGKLFTT